jgi:hypothetical protein
MWLSTFGGGAAAKRSTKISASAAAAVPEHLARKYEILQRPVGHQAPVLQGLICHGADVAALQPRGNRSAFIAKAVLCIAMTVACMSSKWRCRAGQQQAALRLPTEQKQQFIVHYSYHDPAADS